MTVILCLIVRIYGHQFKCNYLRNKNIFEFFTLFLKSTSRFEDFENKDDPHNLCISESMDTNRRG